jgi:hypothetical protein
MLMNLVNYYDESTVLLQAIPLEPIPNDCQFGIADCRESRSEKLARLLI